MYEKGTERPFCVVAAVSAAPIRESEAAETVAATGKRPFRASFQGFALSVRSGTFRIVPSGVSHSMSFSRSSGFTRSTSSLPSRTVPATVVLPGAWSWKRADQFFGQAGKSRIFAALALHEHQLQGIQAVTAVVLVGHVSPSHDPRTRRSAGTACPCA